MPFWVYILRSNSNRLYIGQTNNLPHRVHQHALKSTNAAKYIKDNDDFHLVYSEQYETRIESMHREKQLKGWTRAKKEALICGDLELHKTTHDLTVGVL